MLPVVGGRKKKKAKGSKQGPKRGLKNNIRSYSCDQANLKNGLIKAV